MRRTVLFPVALLLLAGVALGADPDKELEKAAKAGNSAGMVAALQEMRTAGVTKDHVEAILKVVPAVTDPAAFAAARDVLAATTGPAREEVVKALVKGRRIEARVLCADALGGAQDDGAAAALGQVLEDRDMPLRVAAIRALARLARRACIEPLLARHKSIDRAAGGAEVDEVYRALFALTGQAYPNPDDWQKWWSIQPPTFDPKTVAKAGDGGTMARGPVAGKLFETEVRSNAFVLVLDISSSMRVIDLPAGQMWKDAAGKEHPYKDPGMGVPDPASRFARAKAEFTQFIESLGPSTRFSIVVFGDEAKTWKDEIVVANEANKRAASQWVNGLVWTAATVTDKALEKAFSVAGVDTVYLFSDGIPERREKGKNTDIPQDEVIAKAKELNLIRKMRINCYGFATVSPAVRSFLQRLATDHDGEYKDIR